MSISAVVAQPPAEVHRLDLWMSVPANDEQQSIDHLQIDTALPREMQVEKEYGNQVLHVWTEHPSGMRVILRFQCTRRAERAFDGVSDSKGPPPSARLLQPDRLGVINDQIRSLALRIGSATPDPLTRARAIYDYVVCHMDYDKTVAGWGNGDTRRACTVGKGNCTDFHALFISLARASGIPTRFGIGYQLPPTDGDVQGYHCWAEFWVQGRGWVPVDCSEAKKHPDERQYYFGSLDHNRIRMSVGRDLTLPGMHGSPLNYFVFPYAEADGTPVAVEKRITLESNPAS